MSSVVISGDTSGAITLAAPAVAGTNTINLPAAAGTVMVSGNMPAFSVNKSTTDQTFTNGVYTKITFNTEEFDTNNNFASSTFTPTVAGYYQVNSSLDVGANSGTLSRAFSSFYKNGSSYKVGSGIQSGFTGSEIQTLNSCVIYCNGSTDYIEVYVYAAGTSPTVYAGSTNTWFNGVLVRSA
jgi:hypothetical protein